MIRENKIYVQESSIIIDINRPLLQEELEYIFDCWIAFVTGDLGFDVEELPMRTQ